jgi:hypothetical protein
LWNWLFNLAIYVVLCLVVLNRSRILIWTRLAPGSSLFTSWPVLAAAIILILFLAATIHELGHLLAGRFVGLQFHLLVVGPLRIVRDGPALRLSFNKGALFNGLAASFPREGDDNRRLRRRMLVFALGGPLASLALAALAGYLFFPLNANRAFTAANAWLIESAGIMALVSSVVFLTSMRPGHYYNGLPADGGRIITLLRNGPEARRWCALLALNGADIHGQRPRTWDEALIQQGLSVADTSFDSLSARILAYQWALDSGRIIYAGALLDEALATWTTWVSVGRARLVLEKAYFLARHHADPAGARFWLDRVRRGQQAHPWQRRAEAAVLLLEGRKEEAQAQAQAGLAALQREPLSGVVQAEADWLKEIIHLAQL